MINQVTLVGRLTRDPELRQTTEGTPVTHITLAVNRHYRNANGEIDADFVQCTLWRKAAENTYQYCRKGAVVGITGRIQTRSYNNSEGKRIYVTEVVAETVRFLSAKPHETPRETAAPPPATEPPPARLMEFTAASAAAKAPGSTTGQVTGTTTAHEQGSAPAQAPDSGSANAKAQVPSQASGTAPAYAPAQEKPPSFSVEQAPAQAPATEPKKEEVFVGL